MNTKLKIRTFYADVAVWNRFKKKAAAQNLSTAALLRKLIQEFVDA